MNPTTFLKVPEGIVKRANQLGIWVDVVFYYQLKSLTIEGILRKGEIEPILVSRFNLTRPSIWRKLKRLVDLGLVKKEKDFYKLYNYDKLFHVLGYWLGKKTYYKNEKRVSRLGRFKIWHISVDCLSNFLEYITRQEIELNYKRQLYKISQTLKQDDFLLDLIPKNKLKVSLTKTKSLDFIKDQLNINDLVEKSIKAKTISYNEAKIGEDYYSKQSNIDLTLSCSGLARLLGFKSAASGYKLEQRLKELGLLIIKKRKILIEKNPLFANQLYEKVKNIRNYVLADNQLYYYLPNQLVLI